MARLSSLTKDKIEELCLWVADDVPFRYCAEGCGVIYQTFLNWMQKGESDYNADIESLEAELFYRIKKTYATVVRDSVKIIKTKPADRNWQGECWIRQRRDNEFMDKQEIVNNDEKVIVQLGNIKGRHIKGEREQQL